MSFWHMGVHRITTVDNLMSSGISIDCKHCPFLADFGCECSFVEEAKNDMQFITVAHVSL